MNRLFFKIWGLVIAAVLLTLTVETVVFLVGDPQADARAIAQRHQGAMHLIRHQLRHAADSQAQLAALNQQFTYPVDVVSGLPVQSEPGVFAWYDSQLQPTIALQLDPNRWIRLGPLPALPTSPLSAMLLRAAVVMGLVALLLYGMLYGVRQRLLALERAAQAMADGTLHTRVVAAPGTETETIARAFNHMAARVETAIAQREQLLRAVSHELRTPLTRAQLGLHLLDDLDPDGYLDQLGAIETDLNGMDALIQQLLDTARFAHPVRAPLDVPTAIDALIARRRPAFDGHIEQSCAPSVENWLLDENAFERALGTALDNAMRFARSRILIEAQPCADGLLVSIEDDGPGIAEAERERVFEPFVRGDDGGYGLGLSLVRAATRAHGGDASVETSADGGCRLVMRWAAG